jgi:hypothetical protein
MRTPESTKLREPTRWEAIAILCLCALAWVHGVLNPATPRVDGVELQLAFWVQLVLMVVSYVLSAALAPKPETPQPEIAKVPRVEDGKRVILISGTVWIDDPTQLAMQQINPPDPIKTKGGKK